MSEGADTSGQTVVAAFGQTMKTLRVRAGLEREEFGRRIGYSAATVASYEQGRRIPAPRTIERADEVLDAGGLLTVWKEQVERAQYPVFFGEKQHVELQVMPTDREYNAGVDGAFTVITRKDGMRFVYTEAQGTSALQTEPEQTTLAAARYGIIRSQALPSRESFDFVERLLRSL